MPEYAKPASIEEHQNESKWMTWKTQMIRKVPKLQEVTQSEVVVGEVRTAALEILAAVLFAIHIAMQWINFDSIAKCSLVNKIIKSTNLKHRLLLSEGLRIVLVPLPHYFIPPPHFFVSLPHSPWAFQSRAVLPSGEGQNYSLRSVMTEQPSELSPSRSRLFHWAWHTCNMYYIRIYHDIVKTELEWNHRLTVHGSFPLR
jgi:hypothetical protein